MSQLNTQHFTSAVIRLPHNDISDVFSVTQPSSGRIEAKRCGSPHSPTFQVRLKFSDVVVSVTDANAYGGIEILSLAANANHNIMNAAASLTFLKSSGIDTNATSTKWAVGTATASNATLSSTMVNVIPKTAIADFTVAAVSATGYLTTPFVVQGSAVKLYLNFGLETNTDIDADATITVNGELVININSVYADRTT